MTLCHPLDLARRAQPGALAVAIEIMLTTGVRRGEVCALRWSDFDESKQTITVTHSLGNGEGGFYLKQPRQRRSGQSH
ncbi:tyrosine-type recombinase/integrase [Enterorhabdus sp. P55]|uniref:tyrosine-type recombinase/integrase n=1 Tax=Enterorhabdus sp. P55 TaxID=2304571 RepID=UPI00191C378C